MDKHALTTALAQFTGSETFTRHPLYRRVVMTEGVVFLAGQAACWWLLDAVASYLPNPHVDREPFQVWRLRVDPDLRSATLTMTDGNSEAAIVTQALEYTDFPLAEITLWLVQGGELWTLMLPSEY